MSPAAPPAGLPASRRLLPVVAALLMLGPAMTAAVPTGAGPGPIAPALGTAVGPTTSGDGPTDPASADVLDLRRDPRPWTPDGADEAPPADGGPGDGAAATTDEPSDPAREDAGSDDGPRRVDLEDGRETASTAAPGDADVDVDAGPSWADLVGYGRPGPGAPLFGAGDLPVVDPGDPVDTPTAQGVDTCESLGSPVEPGCEEWSRTWNGLFDDHDAVRLAAADPAGDRLYTVGLSRGPNTSATFPNGQPADWDFIVIARDPATGAELWQSRFRGFTEDHDVPRAVAVAPDGSTVYVAGNSWTGFPKDGGTRYDWATVAYDAATGDEVWVARWDSPAHAHDYPYALTVSPDGSTVHVAGTGSRNGNNLDLAVASFDAATGDEVRTMWYDGAQGSDAALSVDATDDVVVATGPSRGAGTLTHNPSFDFATVAFDAATGERLWASRYDSGQDPDYARQVRVAPGGDRVYVAGDERVRTFTGYGDFRTLAYDLATGEELWRAFYRAPQGRSSGLERVEALEVAPDGSYVAVAGTSQSRATLLDYATVVYEADTGAERWSARYHGTGALDDIGFDLALSPDASRVVTTGASWGGFPEWGGTHFDVATVVYDAADGDEVHVFRFNGPGDDQDSAEALAYAADGSRFFPAGNTDTSAQGLDFLTLSYRITDPPTAALDARPSNGTAPLAVTFDLSASDADGTVDAWSLDADGDGAPEASGTGAPPATADHVYPDGGTFEATLRVDDDEGAVATARTTVDVAFAPPKADFGFDPASPTTQDDVAFEDRSTGEVVAWTWDLGDGNTSTDQHPVHRYADDGDHAVTLTVENLDGVTDTVQRTVTVLNADPDADFDFDPGHPDAGETVAFADASTDPDGDVVAWDWDFGDGTTSTEQDPTHVYASNGTYRVRLEVADDDGGTAAAERRIVVGGDEPGDPGVADPLCGDAACVLWTARHDRAVPTEDPGVWRDVRPGMAVATDPAGTRVYLAGTVDEGSGPGGSGTDVRVRALDPVGGAELWSATFDGPGGWHDAVHAAAVSPDGSTLYVTGRTWTDPAVRETSDAHYDYLTLAFATHTGTLRWSATYDGPGRGGDVAKDLVVTPEGDRVVVTGGSDGAGTFEDYATVAYEAATGAEAWVARYAGPAGMDAATALDVTPDGSVVVVTGHSDGGVPEDYDILTAAYDAATGAELWTDRYGPGSWEDHAHDVVAGPDGRAYVTGRVVARFWRYDVLAYDVQTGARAWSADWDNTGRGALHAAVAPDGSRLFVTGTWHNDVESVAQDDDYWTAAYDAATGEELWAARYNGPATDEDVPHALTVSPDGSRVYVTGQSPGDARKYEFISDNEVRAGTENDFATVAYDAATGDEIFVARYNNALADGRDEAIDLVLRPHGGQLYVAGRSQDDDGRISHAVLGYFLTHPPSADLAADPSTGGAPLDVAFHLDASDPDGSVDSWSLDADGDGTPEARGTGAPPATVDHTYPSRGNFTAVLEVSDGEGAVGRATARVEVTYALPVAAFGFAPSSPSTQDVVAFEDRSTGSIVAWDWDLGDGTNSTEQNPTHSYEEDGVYDVTLTVTDDRGNSDAATDQVSVGNALPRPDFDHRPSEPVAGDEVRFLDRSSDPDGEVVAWTWDFGDGATSTEQDPTHTYDEPGTYTVTLEVQDDDGADAEVQRDLRVGERDDGLPDPGCENAVNDHRCEAWVARYAGSGDGNADIGEAVALSPDGQVSYTAGWSWGSSETGYDLFVSAHVASTGSTLWTTRYNGPGNDRDAAFDVDVAPDGRTVYVTGGSFGKGSWGDYVTLALDAGNGSIAWTARYDSGVPDRKADVATALEVAPDGDRVYVTGWTGASGAEFFPTTTNYTTFAYDAATGDVVWSAVYAGEGMGDDAYDLAVAPGGDRVHVVGRSMDAQGQYDYGTVTYDAATGTELWTARMPAGQGAAVDVAPDGTVVATGKARGTSTTGTLYGTVAYDGPTGEERWRSFYHGPGRWIDEARDVEASPAGDRVYVTGWSLGDGTSYDFATVAYDLATGQQRWVARDPTGAWDEATALALSPDGSRAYVTGISIKAGNFEDYGTVAYDTEDGTRLWVGRYNNGGDDYPWDVAVAPDGSRVLVTGQSAGDNWDAATVAYHVTTPPAARLDADPAEDAAPADVTFHVQASDQDGEVDSWSLDADGDGTPDHGGQGPPPATVVHRFPDPGTYEAHLTVGDDDGGVAFATATVRIVVNDPPSLAMPDHVEVVAGDTVTVRANASDPDGDDLTFDVRTLTKVDGATTSVEGTNLTWSWPVPEGRAADTTLEVTVHDRYHDVTASTTVDVRARPWARVLEPLESSTGTPSDRIVLGETTTLRAEAGDPDGRVASVTFHPEGTSGPAVDGVLDPDAGLYVADWAYSTTGTHDLVVTVVDDEDLDRSFTRQVAVVENAAPVADAGDDVLLEEPGATVHLDGSASHDPDGRPVAHVWTLPDGSVVEGPTAEFTPRTAGLHVATLTVEDTVGATSNDTVVVAVDDALAVEAAWLQTDPDRVRPTDRPVLVAEVADEAGTPLPGARVWVNVTHVLLPGLSTSVRGTTDDLGRVMVRLPYDVGEGNLGVNVVGPHRVTVEATRPSKAGAVIPDMEHAATEMAFEVVVA